MAGVDQTAEIPKSPATFSRRLPILTEPIGISPSSSGDAGEPTPTTPRQRVAAVGRLYDGPGNRGQLGKTRRMWEKIGLGTLAAGFLGAIGKALVSNQAAPRSEERSTQEGWRDVEIPKALTVDPGDTILGLAPRYLGNLRVDELRKQVYQTSGMGINSDGSVNMSIAEGELIPGVQIAFPVKTPGIIHLGIRPARYIKTTDREIVNGEDGKPTYTGGDIPGLPSKFEGIDDTDPNNPLVVLIDGTKLPIGFEFRTPNGKPARIALRLKDQSLNQKSGDRLVIQTRT